MSMYNKQVCFLRSLKNELTSIHFTRSLESKNSRRGFTLIELLVVIAIIGILASVVLASLNSARAKGADAAIKSNLANIRAQAEIVYDDATPNSYATVCDNSIITNAITSALSAAGDSGTVATRCGDDVTVWAAWVTLKTDATKAWCVDSTGASRRVATPAGALTACPAAA